ncbi:serine--tRNA ligase [Kitasatospora sp. MAA4]|uniref:serine--tRNA ligase n=1 Tax=Kitasatospora sp. MAA4 TaxID=3035093 RepID=UPI0024759C54|nr:serine--tRNA ligase [Kitasatospora sp. MAA4]
MIDLKAARQDPARFRAALARRGAADAFDALLAADTVWRELTDQVDRLRARNKPKGSPTAEQIEQFKQHKEQLRSAEENLAKAADERQNLLDRLPNLPHPTAPDGGEDEGEVLRTWGEIRPLGFTPRDHLELESRAGWVDMKRGTRLSGSRFAYRVGDVALAETALYRFALDRIIAKGFTYLLPPVLVNERAMYGTGYLPNEESNLYRLDEKDELYLSGTSEVALGGFHMGERLEESQLPARYTAFSTNFRREAGSAGKDTRGMFRVHQFDKVEMFVFCLPEQSERIHEEILAIEEEIIQALGLPYRVVNIAIGDLGNPAAKKYDIEAWFPAQQRYREVTSCSSTTDYQARRLNTRVRREAGTEFVHTVNGTGITARALLAVMENFQDEHGTVTVPEPLQTHGAPPHLGRTR